MVLSCFSDMADEERKIVNSFGNSSYGKKLSKVVKLIDRWVVDVLKREEMAKFLFAMI